jgi:hypothetical protein
MHLFNRREIPVVCYLPAADPPNPLGWVEFGGIRRQEDALHAMSVLAEELFQISCFVPGSVVQDEIYFPPGILKQVADKVAKGLVVESGSLLGQEASRFGIDCPEETDFLAGRGRDHTWLLPSAGPHSRQGTVPLKMDFVLAPDLNIGVFHPLIEVFLNASWRLGSASCALRRGRWRVKPSW